IGTGGSAALGALNSSGAAVTVVFDDLFVFDTVRTVLDTFSGPYPGGWQDHFSGIATNYNTNGANLTTLGGVNANQVSGTFKANQTFKITEGVRLELRADVLDNTGEGGPTDNFTVFAYSPNGDADFAGLATYHIAVSG